jgi:hypothetical protein
LDENCTATIKATATAAMMLKGKKALKNFMGLK